MSLINQMLRDLDRREAAEGPRQVVTPASVSPRPVIGRRVHPTLWALPIIATLLVAIYFQPRMAPLFDPASEHPVGASQEQTEELVAIAVHQETVPSTSVGTTEQAVVTDHAMTPGDENMTRLSSEGLDTTGTLPGSGEDMAITTDEPAKTGMEPIESKPLDTPLSRETVRGRIADQTARQLIATRPVTEPVSEADSTVTVQPDERLDPLVKAEIVKPLKMKPVSVAMEQPLVRVQKVAPETVRESAENVYATALMHLEEGHLQEAEAALRRCLTLDRTHTEARRLLVMLLLKDGERKEAEALLDAGLNIVPGAISLGALRARLLMEDGDLSRAVGLLEQQRVVAGDEIELLSLLGSAYQQTRQFPDAIGIYRRIIEQQPDNARAVAGLAIALDATGDHGEALPVYREALAFGSLPAEVSEYARKRVSALSVER